MAPDLLTPEAHVLVVEDDGEMRNLIAKFLRQNGYRATGARDGREMWETLANAAVDLILLDVMLPGQSGLDLTRALRAKTQVPIIMVTARGDETDRVLGLELGADDYIPKPFSRPELLARIRAVLRRAQGSDQRASGLVADRLLFAGWALDTRYANSWRPMASLSISQVANTISCWRSASTHSASSAAINCWTSPATGSRTRLIARWT